MLENFQAVEFEINDSFLEVPPEVCINRDFLRARPVGPSVIINMAVKAGLVDDIGRLRLESLARNLKAYYNAL